MIHKNDCKCVNCKAKGSPIREVFLKEATAKILSEIEILDWLEGYGQILSLASQKLINKYGFMLIKMQKKFEILKEQNKSQADTIGKYQESICKLRKKNGALLNQEYKLIIERDNALEQRTADWTRIHSLEADVNNLRGEITMLRNRSNG